MRGLKQSFLYDLKSGCLSKIISKVQKDKDLDLQIRENYINIYYKGNSLIKLTEASLHTYAVDIHSKFLDNVQIPMQLRSENDTDCFIDRCPFIKENIIKYGSSTVEAEYEQLVIRANNLEGRSNSDYYILDRQYSTANRDRFDLTGFYWDRAKRSRGQQVPLCFFELKFALNQDLKNVHEQIYRYYQHIKNSSAYLAKEAKNIFTQKLELGLLNQPGDRMDALKTLTFSENVDDYQFILLLVDYNPNSSLLDLVVLKSLPFSNQIRIFHGGFGLWESRLKSLL